MAAATIKLPLSACPSRSIRNASLVKVRRCERPNATVVWSMLPPRVGHDAKHSGSEHWELVRCLYDSFYDIGVRSVCFSSFFSFVRL